MKPLRSGELAALAGAIALIVLSTRPWYGHASAWSTLTVVLAFDLATAAMGLALALFTVTERTPALPMLTAVWTVPVALVGLIALIVRVLDTPAHTGDLRYGAWGSVIAAALVLAGAWQSMRDERTSLHEPPDVPVRKLPEISSTQ